MPEQNFQGGNKNFMITAIRGFKDILPSEVDIWQYVETVSQKLLQYYGFSELRLPMVEDTSLFVRSIGEETDIVSKEMYTFPDRKGHSLTLRPEGTASVVRAFVEHKMYSRDQYKKLYYLGPMFRYERPQAGRSRQFHQLGVEVFGLAEAFIDAEILIMLYDLLTKLGLTTISLSLNSVGCLNCRPKYKQALQESLSSHLTSLCPECQQRYNKNPLRILDCKNEECQSLLSHAPVILEYLCSACRQHFQEVEELLRSAHIPYNLNPRLVRGLDYYTRTAFEVIAEGLGAQNAVAGGGRYDNLVENFGGPSTPAIGFALGMERIILALQGQGFVPKGIPQIFIAALGRQAREEAFSLIRALRQKGFCVEMSYADRSLKSQLKQANQQGYQFTVILGDQELANKKIMLKDMINSSQEEVALDNIFEVMKAKINGTERR